jgi:glycosyltransferase involved in cell wall biosynthesis
MWQGLLYDNPMDMDDSKKVYIVIPALNEAEVIQEVIVETKKSGYENIIVIDDGSEDSTFQKAKEAGAIALRHEINRGKGAAAKTGIEAAKMLGADIIVTMDGDGQHDPSDIQSLILPVLKGKCDVVLGTRLKKYQGMPWYKIIYNWIGNAITWYLFGLWVADSQSGMRAYSKKAIELINTKYDRYEYESEVIREIYIYKLKYKEVPIKVRYTDYSKNKKNKQNFANGVKTFYKMLWKLIS